MSRTRPPLRPWVGAATGLHRTRRVSMAATELQAIVRFRFHDGDVEEFKRVSAQCMEIVRTQDTVPPTFRNYLGACFANARRASDHEERARPGEASATAS